MKVKYQGKDVEVQEVEVVTSNENWNEYQLADGTVISIKLILIRVAKALTERNEQGEPLYIVNSQNVVKTKTTG